MCYCIPDSLYFIKFINFILLFFFLPRSFFYTKNNRARVPRRKKSRQSSVCGRERLCSVVHYLIQNDNNGGAGGSSCNLVEPSSKPSINMASLCIAPKRCVFVPPPSHEGEEEKANVLVNWCPALTFRPLSSSHRP